MISKEQANEVKKAVKECLEEMMTEGFVSIPVCLAAQAIDSLVEPEKPEHYDGEPCALPVRGSCQQYANGMSFVYTGEYRDPCVGEWVCTKMIQCPEVFRVTDWATGDPRWILRVVPEKPNHRNGEPCELPIADNGDWINKSSGYRFEYTGEYRAPNLMEWFVDYSGHKISRANIGYAGSNRWILRAVLANPEHYDGELFRSEYRYTGEFRTPLKEERFVDMSGDIATKIGNGNSDMVKVGWQKNPYARWILRAVKEEPQWKVGMWAWCIQCERPINITKIQDIYVWDELDGKPYYHDMHDLRPLQDADWTRTIAGVKVRAYENKEGGILLNYSDDKKCGNFFFPEVADLARELLAAKGVPIMPYLLSGGIFKKAE